MFFSPAFELNHRIGPLKLKFIIIIIGLHIRHTHAFIKSLNEDHLMLAESIGINILIREGASGPRAREGPLEGPGGRYFPQTERF